MNWIRIAEMVTAFLMSAVAVVICVETYDYLRGWRSTRRHNRNRKLAEESNLKFPNAPGISGGDWPPPPDVPLTKGGKLDLKYDPLSQDEDICIPMRRNEE